MVFKGQGDWFKTCSRPVNANTPCSEKISVRGTLMLRAQCSFAEQGTFYLPKAGMGLRTACGALYRITHLGTDLKWFEATINMVS